MLLIENIVKRMFSSEDWGEKNVLVSRMFSSDDFCEKNFFPEDFSETNVFS